MKKIFLLSLLFLIPSYAYSSPSSTLSVTPVATDGTTITASDENSRNNTISTIFNAHDHNDIDQSGNTLAVGDATAGNKTITANNADASKPFIRYDDTADDWVFSVDGSNVAMGLSGSGLTFEGDTANDYETTVSVVDPTADRSITFPDASGEVTLLGQSITTSSKSGSFTRDISTASGSQAVTGVGFKPSVVIVIAAVTAAEKAMSVGFVDSDLTESSIGWNGTGGITFRDTSSLVSMYVNGSATMAEATVSSLDGDGFTLSWTKTGSPTGTANIYYLAIK